jgi:hypothetical protein
MAEGGFAPHYLQSWRLEMKIQSKKTSWLLPVAMAVAGLLLLIAATAQGQGTGAGPGDLAQPEAFPLFWAEDFSAPLPPDTYYITATTGSGIVEGGSFLLTQNSPYQRGRIFYMAPTPMVAFSATFHLYLGGDPGGADGAAFLFCPVYDYPPDDGGTLDASCPGGYLVAFDTYEDGGGGPDRVYVAYEAHDNRLAVADVPELEDGGWHTAAVLFQQPFITVTLDGSDVIAGAELPGYTPFLGYFGFSAATGALSNQQRVDAIQVYAPGVGALDGHVYDGTTGDPIEGATVSAGVFAADSDATGYFTMTLAPGTYDVVAEHPMYSSDTASGVEIITDTVTTQDFSLVPRGRLYGYVTDYDNGFPLEATVTAGDGTTAGTDPSTGYYEMYLDEGAHTVTASAADYGDGVETVSIVSGEDTQQDFALMADVSFVPSPLHVTLDWQTTDTADTTLLNRMVEPYGFEFSEIPGGFTPLSLGEPVEVTIPAAPAEAPAGTAVAGGPYTPRPALTLDIWPSSNLLAGPNVLLVHADDGSGEPLRSQLLAFGDMGTVDGYDARYSIPTLAELLPYDVVIAWNNDYYADSTALGDVLADYVDAGGKVILATFNWQYVGFGLGGRFMSEFYSPFLNPNMGNHYTTANLGTYDPSHPIMAGVTAASDYYRDYVDLDPGATLVASWDDGEEYVATKGSVVAINSYPGYYYAWTGDVDLIFHNAVLWLVFAGDVPWLGEDPITGTVPASGTLDVTVHFSATYDAGVSQPGDYYATLVVDGDPRLKVPVQMTVLPAQDMGKVEGYVLDNCTGEPVEATLEIAGGDPITQTVSDPDTGYYAVWLVEGSYDGVFSADGYLDYDATLDVTAGQTTTLNVDLVPDRPCISVEPDMLEVWVVTGTLVYTHADGLDITNDGGQDLEFEIAEISGTVTLASAAVQSFVAPAGNAGPRSGPEMEGVEPIAPSSSYATGAGCLVAVTADSGGPNEIAELHATLDEFGFGWLDVTTVQQARDAGADVLIDRYAAVNMPYSDINDWLNDGYGYVELGDWPAWFPDTWEGQPGGTPLNIAVADSGHPLAKGLPAAWTGLGFYAYDWSSDALGWVTNVGYPNIVEAQYATLRERVVTAEEVGPGRAAYIGINTYGYKANDPDKRVLRNAIEWTGQCGAEDVPWVWEDPVSGTVPAGPFTAETLNVDVLFTAVVTDPLPLGTYTATLRVLNNDPVAGTQEVLVLMHIVEEYLAPIASFECNAPVCLGETAIFTNTTIPGIPPKNAEGQVLETTYLWDFGDGETSTEFEPTHDYAAAGTYDVSLEACNPAGMCDTYEDTVEVLPWPQAGFTYAVDVLEVTFTNTSLDALTYEWEFGDGTGSADENPVHTYAGGGTYTVVLTATNDCAIDVYSEAVEVIGLYYYYLPLIHKHYE